MNAISKFIVGGSFLGILCVGTFVAHAADEELTKRASWAPVTFDSVKAQLDTWLAARKSDEATHKKVAALWPKEAAGEAEPETLDRLCESFALVEPQANEILKQCRGPRGTSLPPKFAILSDEKEPSFLRNNLRLLYGRWLAQNALYDEALEQIAALQPKDVIDPATLLFYQSIAHHRLLEKEAFEKAFTKLMENEKAIPRRYQLLAKLMEADIKPLKKDSLDEVSRMMDDIRRRLDLGHAGKKVRKEEDDVIAKLDKMIEDLEDQQKKQQQSSGQGSGGSNAPSSPRQDSTPGGVKGAGNIDPKNVGNKSGWGNLPPKDRQEAMQQISKDLPAHFHDAIQEYNRKLARDGGKK